MFTPEISLIWVPFRALHEGLLVSHLPKMKPWLEILVNICTLLPAPHLPHQRAPYCPHSNFHFHLTVNYINAQEEAQVEQLSSILYFSTEITEFLWQHSVMNWVPVPNLKILKIIDWKTVFTREKIIATTSTLEKEVATAVGVVGQLNSRQQTTEPEGTW